MIEVERVMIVQQVIIIIVLTTATVDGGGVCCGRCQKPEEEFWGYDRSST